MKKETSSRQACLFNRLNLLKYTRSKIPGCRKSLHREAAYCIIKHCTDIQPYWNYTRYQAINKAFLSGVKEHSIAAILYRMLGNIQAIKDKPAYFYALANDQKRLYYLSENYRDEKIWPLIKARTEGTKDPLLQIEVNFINHLFAKGEHGAQPKN
jgi:hypothetical protein